MLLKIEIKGLICVSLKLKFKATNDVRSETITPLERVKNVVYSNSIRVF